MQHAAANTSSKSNNKKVHSKYLMDDSYEIMWQAITICCFRFEIPCVRDTVVLMAHTQTHTIAAY